MFCSQCGSRLDDGAIFCSKCGAKLVSNTGGGTPQEVTTNKPTSASTFSTGGLNETVFYALCDLSEAISVTYELSKKGRDFAPRFDHLYNSFSLDIKDNMRKINGFFTEHDNIWWKGLTTGIGEKFDMYPNIPEKRLSFAKGIFTGMGADEPPLLLYGKKDPFMVTNKCLYARNVKDAKIFSWDLRRDVLVQFKEELAICTFLVFDQNFKVQVFTNKRNEMGFQALVFTVLRTAHLLRHLQGPPNMRFIDALNELRKMPLSDKEKKMDDPYKYRKWADWIDFCYDENANIEF